MATYEKNSGYPADNAAAITPDDDEDLTTATRGIYVGVAGNIAVIFPDGSTATFVGCVAGTVLPLRVARVKATGTTATNLIALW